MREILEMELSALEQFDMEALDRELAECGQSGALTQENLWAKYDPVRSAMEKKLLNCIGGHTIENVLDILLTLMGLVLRLDSHYRKNIEGFNAVYVFTDKTGDFYSAAVFRDNKLTVTGKKVENPTFTLIFKDNRALIKLLFSGAPDILNAMLNQEVDFDGNINYMSKFAYMALHLMLGLTGGIVFAEETADL